jgi:hypothetical protein
MIREKGLIREIKVRRDERIIWKKKKEVKF